MFDQLARYPNVFKDAERPWCSDSVTILSSQIEWPTHTVGVVVLQWRQARSTVCLFYRLPKYCCAGANVRFHLLWEKIRDHGADLCSIGARVGGGIDRCPVLARTITVGTSNRRVPVGTCLRIDKVLLSHVLAGRLAPVR
jgi:hypothetical protein